MSKPQGSYKNEDVLVMSNRERDIKLSQHQLEITEEDWR